MEFPAENAIAPSMCWELLGSASVGRIALSVRALPAILPVEYYLDGADLAICLGQYRLNPRAVNNVVVAFAADAIDPATRSGWTVQVQGVARLPRTVGVPTECGHPTAGQIVHVTPETIMGQHLQLCPLTAGLLTMPGSGPPSL